MTATGPTRGLVAAVSASLALSGCSTLNESPTVTTSSRSNPSEPDGASDPAATDRYRDGEYSATGTYGGQPSHHDVTLTLSAGIITEVSVSTPAEDPTSLEFQRAFADAVPEAVLGRHIDDVELDRLAGASSSPQGFNDALAQIRADAGR